MMIKGSRLDHVLYTNTVEAYLKDDRKSLKCMMSKGLSSSERLLIEARLYNRRRKFDKAKNCLRDISTVAKKCRFIQAEALFVEGSICAGEGNYEKAALFNFRAYKQYEQMRDERGLFLSSYNLCVDYSRLGLLSLSNHWLNEAEKYVTCNSERALVDRAKACSLSKEGRLEEACERLEKALEEEDELYIRNRFVLYAVAADIFFRAGKEERALIYLEKRRNTPFSSDRQRAYFEYHLLNARLKNKSLPPLPELIKTSHEFSIKWSVAKALQSGDMQLAGKFWDALVKLFPQTYAGGFKCLHPSDTGSIFYRFVESLENKKRGVEGIDGLSKGGKLYSLYNTIRSSDFPLRKEELIERVWETSYSPELDNRFYKLLERLRKKTGFPIICRNNAYRFEAII